MSISQTVRNGGNDPNNPTGLLEDILGVSRILVNNTPPILTSGRNSDYFIDNTTGDLYGPKSGGVWGPPIYNFSGGAGGTLTNLSNIGGGVRSFKGLNGTVAELRTLSSGGNGIVIEEDTPETDTLNFSIADSFKPVLLSGYRDNGVVQVSIGSGTFDPNGLFGSPEYNLGSLFIQVGTTDRIWVCNNPTTKVWLELAGEDLGIKDIENVGSGAPIYLDTTAAGVARLKRIQGTSGQVLVNSSSVFETNTIEMVDSYVPVALDKLYNIQDNRTGPLSNPTVNDDSSSGWSRGSLWVEQEVSGNNIIWICNNAANGAAEWVQYNPSGSSTIKDHISFIRQSVGYLQSVTGGWQDFNTGALPALIEASAPSSKFTYLNDGSRGVFRRNPVTNPKSYMCTFTVIVSDFAGATANEKRYLWRMKRKSDGAAFDQSLNVFVLPQSTDTSRWATVTNTFVFDEPSTAQNDYWLELEGVGGAQDFNVEFWGVSFKEV